MCKGKAKMDVEEFFDDAWEDSTERDIVEGMMGLMGQKQIRNQEDRALVLRWTARVCSYVIMRL